MVFCRQDRPRRQDRPCRQDRPLTIKVESRGISSCDNRGGISWISVRVCVLWRWGVRVWRWGIISLNDWVIAEKLLESADRAHNCHEMHIEQFIDEIGWLIDDVGLVLMVAWPWPLGLYEEIDDARTPCTWLVHVLRHREYRLSDNSRFLPL